MPHKQAATARHVLVALPVPLREAFHYSWSGGEEPVPGRLVRVPFGSRRLIGVITAISEPPPDLPRSKIRSVLEVLEYPPELPASLMKLCDWAADYYHHPIGEVYASALPGLVRQGKYQYEPPALLALTPEGMAVDPGSLTRAPAQRNAMQALIEAAPAGLTRDAINSAGIRAQTIRVLIDKQWAHWSASDAEADDVSPQQGLTLTEEQAVAVDAVLGAGRPRTFLLDGVTGSGKTEVYLQVIRHLLQQGRQVLVLVPEIGLTPQTIARFEHRFGFPVNIFHSAAGDRERADTWHLSSTGQARIVIGTRSAIFLPFRHLAAIIVDEEHDASYKQQDGFRYSARDLAVLRGQFEKVPVLLGSATPSLESLHNCAQGKYTHLRLSTRPPGVAPENYELLDTRHLEKTDGFTRRLNARIRETLEAGNQVLVFLNRRGYAPVLICNECGWIADCRRCDARLTYHLTTRSLVCHHCGTVSHNIISCQSCRSNQVAAIGIGTERVEETLLRQFDGYPVLRIDRDSTRRKGAMEKMVSRINSGEPCILVGTQLLAKGHHFPAVTLVAILDIDSGFYSTDFRATERVGQLIVQVGGRSGRAERPGRVIIQTEFADHLLLQHLVKDSYASFAELLLKEREDAELPPFVYQALLRAEATDGKAARLFLEKIAALPQVNPAVSLLGPVPALMEKRSGRYRQLLIVMSPTRSALHRELDRLIDRAASLPDANRVRWSLDVDPLDLF